MTIPKLEQRHIEALEKTISFAQSMAYEKEHEDAFRLVTELPAILRAMQERDAELGADERRMNWIIDKCFQSGGGHGFTVFVPVDTECLRDGIDLAMNTATPPQAPAVQEDPQPYFDALLRYTKQFYEAAIAHGMRAGATANAVAHVERAARNLLRIAQSGAPHPAPAVAAEPVAASYELLEAARDKLVVLISEDADIADQAEAADLAERIDNLLENTTAPQQAPEITYEAACNGLRYANPEACGEVAAVHIGKERWPVQQPAAVPADLDTLSDAVECLEFAYDRHVFVELTDWRQKRAAKAIRGIKRMLRLSESTNKSSPDHGEEV